MIKNKWGVDMKPVAILQSRWLLEALGAGPTVNCPQCSRKVMPSNDLILGWTFHCFSCNFFENIVDVAIRAWSLKDWTIFDNAVYVYGKICGLRNGEISPPGAESLKARIAWLAAAGSVREVFESSTTTPEASEEFRGLAIKLDQDQKERLVPVFAKFEKTMQFGSLGPLIQGDLWVRLLSSINGEPSEALLLRRTPFNTIKPVASMPLSNRQTFGFFSRASIFINNPESRILRMIPQGDIFTGPEIRSTMPVMFVNPSMRAFPLSVKFLNPYRWEKIIIANNELSGRVFRKLWLIEHPRLLVANVDAVGKITEVPAATASDPLLPSNGQKKGAPVFAARGPAKANFRIQKVKRDRGKIRFNVVILGALPITAFVSEEEWKDANLTYQAIVKVCIKNKAPFPVIYRSPPYKKDFIKELNV